MQDLEELIHFDKVAWIHKDMLTEHCKKLAILYDETNEGRSSFYARQ